MSAPVQHRDLSELMPNARNPRTITDAKREMLRNSLARFGDISGVVYNRRSGQLVGGHMRTVAFTHLTDGGVVIERTLKEPSITGTVAEGYVSMAGERFAYREVDWDAATESAANLAANKGAGDWNFPALQTAIEELSTEANFSLDLTMFDQEERAAYLPNVDDMMAVPPDAEPQEDTGPGASQGEAPDDVENPEGRYVKMVQLFYNKDAYQEFIDLGDRAQAAYNKDNLSEAVLAALQKAHGNNTSS